MSTTQNTSASYNTTETHPTALLVWDAPNLDMGLGAILGSRPTAAHRPRFDAVGKWLIDEAERVSNKIDSDVLPEATVFTNVNPGSAEIVRPWVEALRNVGFAVFAKPKIEEDTDVDPDMIAHIQRRYDEGVLRSCLLYTSPSPRD